MAFGSKGVYRFRVRMTDLMVTPDLFRQILGNWASGVSIVATSGRDGRPYGLTVSSFTSVSLNPPLILVCLDNRISGLQAFKDSGKFGVSVLSEEQAELSTLFAKKDTDRPPELYFEGAFGVPLIKGALVTLECTTWAIYDGGDHQILVGEMQAAEVGSAKDGKGPLLYCRGRYGTLA
jgi:flavin reductase (DIM6/NTAB) family NADH-FMN oxidoreductase RutF